MSAQPTDEVSYKSSTRRGEHRSSASAVLVIALQHLLFRCNIKISQRYSVVNSFPKKIIALLYFLCYTPTKEVKICMIGLKQCAKS